MEENTNLQIAEEVIRQRIFLIREKRVMLDSDLARLYGVKTKDLNLSIKRNLSRFPLSFMFQLTKEEYENLRFQFATSSLGHGGRRYLPHVFTEHGVAMLSAVLNSQKAIKMSIFIIQAFIKMREILLNQENTNLRLLKIENKQEKHDKTIEDILKTLKQLTDTPLKPPGPIGFVV